MTLRARLDRLAAQIGERPATKEERLHAWVSGLSSGERRKRLAELILTGHFGRAPTVAEVNDHLQGKDIDREMNSPAAFEVLADVAEQSGRAENAARFRKIAASKRAEAIEVAQ